MFEIQEYVLCEVLLLLRDKLGGVARLNLSHSQTNFFELDTSLTWVCTQQTGIARCKKILEKERGSIATTAIPDNLPECWLYMIYKRYKMNK